ncbi:cell division protein ZipA [Alkalilimnicola ehrlichii MLHE-1]|uniref:Cell division protein ZipA n=1 Tax=Alkalilimnicola ehrlichii (strain ATCC BAA-1101 / DSM 17681 / MLHE-1) TaxID=187272 RepID=Q0AAV3_ALKEH|nr:cell division protein ZipA [Alkalilimnicola ehrlichii]ABI56034.1 cell division protein ZipA [Alkalilimnicola ehrlichii MLHE-1]
MDPFRWLLIILGLLLIAGIYAWGRWQDKKRARGTGRHEDYDSAFDAMDSAVGGPDDFEVIVKKPRRHPGADAPSDGDDADFPGRPRRREPTGLDADLDWPDDEPEPKLGLDDELDESGEPDLEPTGQGPGSARPQPSAEPAPEQPSEPRRDRGGAAATPPTGGKTGARREPARPAEPPVRDRPDLAALGTNGPGTAGRDEPVVELPAGPQVDIEAADLEDKIVAIHVAAPEGHVFVADALVDALQRAGLEYGEHGIFHRHVRTERGPARVFSVANMIKPGWFDLDRAAEDETPGAAFFLQLPGPVDGMAAFDDMLGVARRVADELGGRLLDGRRCDLSRQAMEHIREELREYRRRLHLAARKQQG